MRASRCRPARSIGDTADAVGLALDGETIEFAERQGGKQFDPRVELTVRFAEGLNALVFRAFRGSRIGNTPMSGDGIAGPNRADFARGLIAYGENEVHRRRVC